MAGVSRALCCRPRDERPSSLRESREPVRDHPGERGPASALDASRARTVTVNPPASCDGRGLQESGSDADVLGIANEREP